MLSRERFIELIIMTISILVALLVSVTPAGRLLDLKIYDIFSMIKPKPAEWNKIVYVDIDDQSIDLVGQYPWPRDIMAKGVTAMKELGASRVILDIEYIDNSPMTLNQSYLEELDEKKPTRLPLTDIYKKLVINPDWELGEAIRTDPRNVYLACRGTEDTSKERTRPDSPEMKDILKLFFQPLKTLELTNHLSVDRYLEIPVKALYIGAKDLGFTYSAKDLDGALRRIELFRIFENKLVPQLSLPALMDELGVDREKIDIRPGFSVTMTTRDGKKISIPINRKGEMYINWTGKWDSKKQPFGQHISFSFFIEYYNMKQAMAEQLPYLNVPGLPAEDRAVILENLAQFTELSNKLAAVEGKITITGWTAEATTDIGAITIDPQAPLVLLQGNVINTIYQGAFLRQWPFFLNLLLALGVAFSIFLASIRINSAFRETIVSGIILAVVVLGMYFFLALFGIILNYILIVTASFISLFGFTAYKFIAYDNQKNFIKKAFMQYLSPDVVKQVLANPNYLKLGGERREITAYFSDVASFTSLSELLSPEEVVGLLNEYLTAMTDIIMKNGGTVDKYEGDAIVGFFGAPIPTELHAEQCCRAAIEMRDEIARLKEKWEKAGAKWTGPDFPPFAVRQGINTGPAVIGNMGSQQRMDYTMMGDTVNTASRFEGANKEYGTSIMISEMTLEKLTPEFIVRQLDVLKVKGKNKPIAVYELVGLDGQLSPEKVAAVAIFKNGLETYFARDWKGALEIFQECVDTFDDGPSKTYVERCKKFIKTPPPPDWDGAFTLKTK